MSLFPLGRVGKQAKVLTEGDFQRLLKAIKKKGGEHWLRAYVAALLSFLAGLRPCEIAGLMWDKHVCTATGEIAGSLTLTSDISKKDHGRNVPIAPELRAALKALRALNPDYVYVFYPINVRDGSRDRVSANAVSQFFRRLYGAIGFKGCSAYSGRRTWITQKARQANLARCSLRDVQMMAGHRSLVTTAKYIEPSSEVRTLVEMPLFATHPLATDRIDVAHASAATRRGAMPA